MKQKIFRKFAALMMAVVAMNCSGMTVFAAEDIESMQPVETIVDEANSAIDTQQSTTNLVSNATYYWNQSTSSAIIFPEFHCDSAPNINIYFECIARSNDAGTFHVKLQKKGAFGIWSTVGNIYTTSQHGTQSYNLRTGQYVQGAWNRFSWNTDKGGDYRIVVEDATNKQGTELSGVYIWKRQ